MSLPQLSQQHFLRDVKNTPKGQTKIGTQVWELLKLQRTMPNPGLASHSNSPANWLHAFPSQLLFCPNEILDSEGHDHLIVFCKCLFFPSCLQYFSVLSNLFAPLGLPSSTCPAKPKWALEGTQTLEPGWLSSATATFYVSLSNFTLLGRPEDALISYAVAKAGENIHEVLRIVWFRVGTRASMELMRFAVYCFQLFHKHLLCVHVCAPGGRLSLSGRRWSWNDAAILPLKGRGCLRMESTGRKAETGWRERHFWQHR